MTQKYPQCQNCRRYIERYDAEYRGGLCRPCSTEQYALHLRRKAQSAATKWCGHCPAPCSICGELGVSMADGKHRQCDPELRHCEHTGCSVTAHMSQRHLLGDSWLCPDHAEIVDSLPNGITNLGGRS